MKGRLHQLADRRSANQRWIECDPADPIANSFRKELVSRLEHLEGVHVDFTRTSHHKLNLYFSRQPGPFQSPRIARHGSSLEHRGWPINLKLKISLCLEFIGRSSLTCARIWVERRDGEVVNPDASLSSRARGDGKFNRRDAVDVHTQPAARRPLVVLLGNAVTYRSPGETDLPFTPRDRAPLAREDEVAIV